MNPVVVSALITLGASGAAGWLASRFRLPGGAIIWALGVAAAVHLTWSGLAPLPEWLRVLAQILVGTVLGVGVTRSPLLRLWRVRTAVLAFTGLLVGLCLALAVGLAILTPLDFRTAAFAIAPGGATDMATASLHFEVDGVLVAGIQVLRQLLVFVLVPVVLALVAPPRGHEKP